MILLIDLGNHRVKWQVRSVPQGDPRLRGVGSSTTTAWWEPILRDIGSLTDATKGFVASVADEQRTRKLVQVLQSRGIRDVVVAAPLSKLAGVHSGYEDPGKLGIDRWCAIVAAYRRCRRPVLVADVGTAWTYDLVDAAGQHRGGWIAPGPYTQRWSLHATTARLPMLERLSEVPDGDCRVGIWGRDTAEAMLAGIGAMIEGYATEAEERARSTLGEEASSLCRLATGGDQETLSLLEKRGYFVVEDLVLDGLALHAQAVLGS